MRTRCLKCKTKYEIPDSRVIGKVLRVRCKRCKNVMKVVGPTHAFDPRLHQHPPTLTGIKPYHAGQDSAPVQTSVQYAEGPVWWCGIGGRSHGPFSPGEVYKLIQRNEIHARTFMWRKGMESWERIGESPRLAFAYNWLVQRAGEDVSLLGPREATNVFDQVALVSDGNSYFPDPTLHTGWLVLDDRTQAYLETAAKKAEERQVKNARRAEGEAIGEKSPLMALYKSSFDSLSSSAVGALAMFSLGVGLAIGGAAWFTHSNMMGI